MWLLKRKKPKTTAQTKPAAAVKPAPRVSRKAEAVKVLNVLDAPGLGLEEDKSAGGFDPYDTGVFDRSKLWESWQNQD
jgi:hypothetical protein